MRRACYGLQFGTQCYVARCPELVQPLLGEGLACFGFDEGGFVAGGFAYEDVHAFAQWHVPAALG